MAVPWNLIIPAATSLLTGYMNKPSKSDYDIDVPETDTRYAERYMANLRGRAQSGEVYRGAMQPQKRQIGQQGRKMQKQVGYDMARMGMEDSGIEAQYRLSAQQQTAGAMQKASEAAMAQQISESRRLGEKADEVQMQIGQSKAEHRQRVEAAKLQSEQAYKTAKGKWQTGMWQSAIQSAASIGMGYMQQAQSFKDATALLGQEKADELLGMGFSKDKIVEFSKDPELLKMAGDAMVLKASSTSADTPTGGTGGGGVDIGPYTQKDLDVEDLGEVDDFGNLIPKEKVPEVVTGADVEKKIKTTAPGGGTKEEEVTEEEQEIAKTKKLDEKRVWIMDLSKEEQIDYLKKQGWDSQKIQDYVKGLDEHMKSIGYPWKTTGPATPVLTEEQIQEFSDISGRRAQALLEKGEYEDIGSAQRGLSQEVMQIAKDQNINELEAIKQIEESTPMEDPKQPYGREYFTPENREQRIMERIKGELPSDWSVEILGGGRFSAHIQEKDGNGGTQISYDKYGRKNLEQHIRHNKDGSLNVKNTIWYENGQIQLEGSTKDNKQYGKWTWYHKNGQIEKEGTYKDGKKDGKWKEWDIKGNKTSEQNFKDGREVKKDTGTSLTPAQKKAEKIAKTKKRADEMFKGLDASVHALETLEDKNIPFEEKIETLKNSLKDKQETTFTSNHGTYRLIKDGDKVYFMKGKYRGEELTEDSVNKFFNIP